MNKKYIIVAVIAIIVGVSTVTIFFKPNKTDKQKISYLSGSFILSCLLNEKWEVEPVKDIDIFTMATKRPSGDQKGACPPSVPASGTADVESRWRIQSCVFPCASAAHRTSDRPSGDSAIAPSASVVALSGSIAASLKRRRS